MDLRKLLILLIMSSYSCNTDKNGSISLYPLSDSTNFYFNKSLNENLPLFKKQEEINKALYFGKRVSKGNLYSQILYQKNNLHFSSQQYDSLLFYNNLLIKHALKIEDYRTLSNQYYLMGYYYSEIAQIPDSAFTNYNTSKNYFLKVQDSSWVGRNLLNMATIQKDQNDFFGSKETIAEALQYLKQDIDVTYIADCYNVLATDHRKLINYSDAIKYYLLALKTTNSEKEKLSYKNNLAATYIDNKEYNNAIKLLKSIRNDSILTNNKNEYARVLDNLAYVKWLNEIPNNSEEFLKPVEIRKANKDKRGQVASYTHLGEFYSKTNIMKATSYFDSVIQLSKTLKKPRAEKDALKFLMDLQPNNVDIRDRYVFLQDSLYHKELQVKTQFAKYKYDDKLKQEDILSLEKENAEKELETSEQRTQKILYLGGFLFISTVLGLSFFGFRQRTRRLKQKSKAERLEAIHETEAELSRKLHDDHGGKLNKVMSLVQRDAQKSLILDNLEIIYNQTRDISRELNSVDTGPNYWNVLKATLEFTKPKEVEMVLNGGRELEWSLVGHQSKTILFKVLQELVINTARHSRASQLVILFRNENENLIIYYADNGVGASKESLLRKNGLQNTEKRIKAIEGSIIFDTEEGKGFKADILIPL